MSRAAVVSFTAAALACGNPEQQVVDAGVDAAPDHDTADAALYGADVFIPDDAATDGMDAHDATSLDAPDGDSG